MNTIQYSPEAGRCKRCFPGPTRVVDANDISIAIQQFLQGSQGHRPTDRPTDHATWSVKSCVIYLTKKQNFSSLSNSRYCADCAQSQPWLAPNIWLTTFQISPKSVHFRRSYSQPREGRDLGPLGKFQYSPEAMHRFGRIMNTVDEQPGNIMWLTTLSCGKSDKIFFTMS